MARWNGAARAWLAGVAVLLLAGPLVGTAAGTGSGPATEDVVVIVAGEPGPAGRARTRDVEKAHGVRASKRFGYAVTGFAAAVDPARRSALERDPRVSAVVPDRRIELGLQELETGADRAEAEWSGVAAIDGVDDPIDVDIAIIDTGVDPTHPDLNVAGGYNCTTPDTSAWAPGAGHGTHVAGIAAARDNGIGVVGVAPGARVWAVRVFDATSFSKLSWIICGIDWVTAQRDPIDPARPLIEVANMSLRDPGTDDGACGSINNDAEHAAICRSVAGGTTYVVSAGNDATDARRWIPASYDEVITVSALADFDGAGGGVTASTCSVLGAGDRDDTFADFSNFGPDVDIIAPGKCLRSTYPGARYRVISGTSMASPLVAGAAALYKVEHPDATPQDVRAALIAAGTNDWQTSTDPDGRPEPLLNVARLTGPPDAGPPVVTAPRTVFRKGSSVSTTGSIPVRSRWTGSDDRGISRYELYRSADGGSFGRVALASRLATSGDSGVAHNHAYRFRAIALDPVAGRTAATSTVTARTVQSSSRSITYRGRWPVVYASSAYGGGVTAASARGASATMTFTARSIGWVATMGPKRGVATVWIDGRQVATVDTYRATTAMRRIVFTKDFDSVGTHTIRIVVAGTAGRPRVDLDAFVLLR